MGRHSANTWNEHDHPRDLDGTFAHGGGGVRKPATSSRGMPNILTGSDIPTRKGGEIALDRHVDGSLTITTKTGTARLGPNDISNLKHAVRDINSEAHDPGFESWIKRVDTDADGRPKLAHVMMLRKEDDDTYSLRVGPNDSPSIAELQNAPALQLSSKDLDKIDDSLRRMDAASRVDTGYGDLDVYMTDDNKFAFRHLGDDGRPVEVVFDKKSFAKLDRATNVVVEGFDDSDPTGPDEGVTHVDVTTNVGKVRVEQLGEWRGNSPEDRFKITPVGHDNWGIYVEGTHQKEFDAAWEKAANAAEMAGFFNRYDY
ncbi:hypothetical protein AB0395_39660 [Streptosporangium sp. NPDC051023]|uniref:hypothetical protein n=1 Tax=Streptosporangium sp. NPDC051023 TaxID=3155410 RepID=UPI00344F9F0D